MVEPGELTLNPGDTITFVAHNSDVKVFIPNSKIVAAGDQVTDIDDGDSQNVTLRLSTDTPPCPRGKHPYAIFCKAVFDFAEGPNSPPYMIIE